MARERRWTKEERRAVVIDAAIAEFAEHGFSAASSEAIAARAHISQPYVFRLFGTKRELFKIVVTHSFDEILARFQESAAGLTGEAAFDAISVAYLDLLRTTPEVLMLQLQACAACGDREVQQLVQGSFDRIVNYVQRVSDVPPGVITRLLGEGMIRSALQTSPPG